MLLVDDDDAELGRAARTPPSARRPRCRPRRARCARHASSARRVRRARVQHRDLVAEARAKARRELRRQRDLGHQHERRAARARAPRRWRAGRPRSCPSRSRRAAGTARRRAPAASARCAPAPPPAPRVSVGGAASLGGRAGERIVRAARASRPRRARPRRARARARRRARPPGAAPTARCVPAAAMRSQTSPRFWRARTPPRAPSPSSGAPTRTIVSLRAPRVDTASSTSTSPRSTSARSACRGGSRLVRAARERAEDARASPSSPCSAIGCERRRRAPPPRALPVVGERERALDARRAAGRQHQPHAPRPTARSSTRRPTAPAPPARRRPAAHRPRSRQRLRVRRTASGGSTATTTPSSVRPPNGAHTRAPTATVELRRHAIIERALDRREHRDARDHDLTRSASSTRRRISASRPGRSSSRLSAHARFAPR